MPDYEHQCQSEDCKYEWEETYSIAKDPPKICPKCGKETAKRVISLGARGVVELSGQDLVDQVKADAKQLQRDAAKDTNKYANLLGEARYHQLQTQLDRRGR
jgi:putative FmdB family regulatory protein